MIFADEVVDPDRIDELDAAREVEINDRELAIAMQLVESLAGEFEPDKYHDTYREDVLALIERKAAGEEIAVQPATEEDEEPVPDLMAALKASLDAVRERAAAAAAATRTTQGQEQAQGARQGKAKAGAKSCAGASARRGARHSTAVAPSWRERR